MKSNPFVESLSDQGMATEDEWGNILRICRIILVQDDVTDTSLFCLPVLTIGPYPFKLALYPISRGLQGGDARVVHTLHDEIIIEARDGMEDQVQVIVEESMERIIPEVPFVAEIRVADSWG